jgi:hypothetical protein
MVPRGTFVLIANSHFSTPLGRRTKLGTAMSLPDRMSAFSWLPRSG